MGGDASLAEKEKERVSLLEEAGDIVAAASARGWELTADEDSQVLALITSVRVLEAEIGHLKRHLVAVRTR